MNLKIARQIADAARTIEANLDVKLRTNYSGRGMMGAKTTALIAPSVAEFVAAACEAAAQLARDGKSVSGLVDAVKAIRTDDMGRDAIVVY
jgi:hypothetical protein